MRDKTTSSIKQNCICAAAIATAILSEVAVIAISVKMGEAIDHAISGKAGGSAPPRIFAK